MDQLGAPGGQKQGEVVDVAQLRVGRVRPGSHGLEHGPGPASGIVGQPQGDDGVAGAAGQHLRQDHAHDVELVGIPDQIADGACQRVHAGRQHALVVLPHGLDDAGPLMGPESVQKVPSREKAGPLLPVIHGLVVAIRPETLELRKPSDIVHQGRGQVRRGRGQPFDGHDLRGQGVDAQGMIAFDDDVLPAFAQPEFVIRGQGHEPGSQATQHGLVHQMP